MEVPIVLVQVFTCLTVCESLHERVLVYLMSQNITECVVTLVSLS